jgi:hypothetical protein
VDANRAPEDSELADLLDELGNPATITLTEIRARATGSFLDWLQDRKNRRAIPHRMESAGYVSVRNDTADDGLWKSDGKRQVIYARNNLPLRDRIAAVQRRGQSV